MFCEAHKSFDDGMVRGVSVNSVNVCRKCWEDSNDQEKRWIRQITNKYMRGLITRDGMDQELLEVAFHIIDPTYPVHIGE